VREISDSNFATEIDSYKGGILVDFSATWCGPCRNLAPTVDSLAEEFRGKVKVVKIDLDQAPSTARRFGVTSIPYLMIYKDGKIIDTHLGAPSREFLRAWLQNISDTPAKIDAPVKTDAPAKPKDLGMRLIPTEQRTIVSDVGQLDRISGSEISGVKYVLRNGGYVLRYIIEPSDVDMSSMVGRTISITGYSIGRSYSDVSVIQMKNASTFG
jgi:thioredoxin